MSRLQNLVYSLINIINNYHASQLAQKHPEPIENFLKKTDEDLNEKLKEMIAAITKKYDGRQDLLEYILYEIKLLKPLVDKKEPLLEEELNLIQGHLLVLVNTTREMLNTLKTSKPTIPVEYDEEKGKVKLNGAIFSYIPRKSFCLSGTVLNTWYKDAKIFPQYQFDAQEFITALIKEHQDALLVPKLNLQVAQKDEEIVGLKATVREKETDLRELEEENLTLKAELELLKIKAKEEKSTIESEPPRIGIPTPARNNSRQKPLDPLRSGINILGSSPIKSNPFLAVPYGSGYARIFAMKNSPNSTPTSSTPPTNSSNPTEAL